MKFKCVFYIFFLFPTVFSTYGQDFKDRTVLGEKVAKEYLKSALQDTLTIKKLHNDLLQTEIKDTINLSSV